MQNLSISGSNVAPDFDFNKNGDFKITGRILTDNAVKTFEPVFNWLSGFEGKHVNFEIKLDYLNTSASMQLFCLLRRLDEDLTIKKINVKWIYEFDDEDHLDTGRFFEEKLKRVSFEYIGTTSIAA
jgi:hypothetical protein